MFDVSFVCIRIHYADVHKQDPKLLSFVFDLVNKTFCLLPKKKKKKRKWYGITHNSNATYI